MARRKGVDNPKPRIGRKDKTYEFSKEFQKRYGDKVRRKTDKRKDRQSLKKTQPPQEEAKPKFKERKVWTIEEVLASGIMGKNVPKQRVFTSALDKVAILANQYGVDGAGEILSLEPEFIQAAIDRGSALQGTREEAILERGYADAKIDYDDIDFDEIERYAENLQQATQFIGSWSWVGTSWQDGFRAAVADGQVDIDTYFNDDPRARLEGYSLFAQGLDSGHRAKIHDYIAKGGDTSEMFDAYLEDIATYGSIFFPTGDERYDQSYFWAWFRETFYP